MRVDSAPSTTKQWAVEGQKGFDSLQLNENAPIPDLGDTECLVRWYYVSLNYRDLLVTKVGSHLATTRPAPSTQSLKSRRANTSSAAKIT